MSADEERTSLDDLMATSPASPLSRGRPPVAALVVASTIGLVASTAAIARLLYWLFPLPWDLLMWVFDR